MIPAAPAAFTADEHGTVDLRRDRPLPGSSYAGTDPMGLIWSMRPTDGPDPQAARDRLAPQLLAVTAQADGSSPATAQVSRLFIPDGLTRTEVRIPLLSQPECNESASTLNLTDLADLVPVAASYAPSRSRTYINPGL